MQPNTLSQGSSATPAARSLEALRHLAWLLVGDATTLDEQERRTLLFLRQHPEVNRAHD